MITITLTDADAEAYIQQQANVKAAVEQLDDLPKNTPASAAEQTEDKPKRKSRAKAKELKPVSLKAVEAEIAGKPVEGEIVKDIPVPDAVEPDVDALRTKFEALVIANYDAAAELIDGFGDDMTFGKIAGEESGDLLREFAVKLEAVS